MPENIKPHGHVHPKQNPESSKALQADGFCERMRRSQIKKAGPCVTLPCYKSLSSLLTVQQTYLMVDSLPKCRIYSRTPKSPSSAPLKLPFLILTFGGIMPSRGFSSVSKFGGTEVYNLNLALRRERRIEFLPSR